MASQLQLFTPEPVEVKKSQADINAHMERNRLMELERERHRAYIDWNALDEIALLYTATECGNATGIHFGMSIKDACKWCSLDISKGVLHGTRWAYFWTSATNYVKHWSGDCDAYGNENHELHMSLTSDNHQWDERVADTGLTMIKLAELVELLEKAGVKVIKD